MFQVIVRRVLLLIPMALGVCTITFFLIHLVPGDPIDILLGDNATSVERLALEKSLGLDLPIHQQYFNFLLNLFQGDLGNSIHTKQPVSRLIRERLFATLELGGAAMILALLWGLPLGVYSAIARFRWLDRITMGISLLFVSVPGIFLGPLLIWLLALQIPIFPVSSRESLMHLVLPAVSLALPLGAVILRMTKSTVADLMHEDFVRTAIAKGANENRVFFHHVLRNALIPVITLIGLQMAAVFTGTVITETIFDWPGLGTLLLQGIYSRDYPIVQACVLVIAVIYVLVNLATDLTYILVNPRMREQGS